MTAISLRLGSQQEGIPHRRLVSSENEVARSCLHACPASFRRFGLSLLCWNPPLEKRLSLLNASDSDCERVLGRVMTHGGVVDSNGKFVELGDPLSQRIFRNEVQEPKVTG